MKKNTSHNSDIILVICSNFPINIFFPFEVLKNRMAYLVKYLQFKHGDLSLEL